MCLRRYSEIELDYDADARAVRVKETYDDGITVDHGYIAPGSQWKMRVELQEDLKKQEEIEGLQKQVEVLKENIKQLVEQGVEKEKNPPHTFKGLKTLTTSQAKDLIAATFNSPFEGLPSVFKDLDEITFKNQDLPKIIDIRKAIIAATKIRTSQIMDKDLILLECFYKNYQSIYGNHILKFEIEGSLYVVYKIREFLNANTLYTRLISQAVPNDLAPYDPKDNISAVEPYKTISYLYWFKTSDTTEF